MSKLQTDDLTFITYTAGSKGRTVDNDARQKIRKKAWNAWWNDEPKKRLHSRAAVSLKQSQTRFKVDRSPSSLHTPAHTAIVKSPSFFPRVAEQGDEHAWHLLAYYFHRFQQNSAAINVDGNWLAFTLECNVTWSAQLSLIALNEGLEFSVANVELVEKHAARTVSLVRKGLNRQAYGLSDALIGAVALLLILESMHGGREHALAHLRGLRALLAARGGLNGFNDQKTLQKVILWSQRCFHLRWPDVVDIRTLRHDTTTPSEDEEQALDASLRTQPTLGMLNRLEDVLPLQLTNIFIELQRIAAFSNISQRSQAERLQVSDAIYDVEFWIMHLQQDHTVSNASTNSNGHPTVSQVVSIAMPLYSLVVLRQMRGNFKVVQRYVDAANAGLLQFLQSLESFGDSSAAMQDLLIWIATLILLPASASKTFDAATEYPISILSSSGLDGVDELECRLRKVAWMTDIMHEDLVVLWERIRSDRIRGNND